MVERATVFQQREHGNPWPRLDQFGYTLRGGSPTRIQVQLSGESRWRRVYVLCFSNCASYIVKIKGRDVFVDIGDS